MKTIGDKVTINAKYSTFDRMAGIITEIVGDSHLKYTVQFEDGEENYFSEEEVK